MPQSMAKKLKRKNKTQKDVYRKGLNLVLLRKCLEKKFAYIQFKFDFKDRRYFPMELHHQSISDRVLREPWPPGTLRGPCTLRGLCTLKGPSARSGRLFSLQGPDLALWSSFLSAPSPHSWPMNLPSPARRFLLCPLLPQSRAGAPAFPALTPQRSPRRGPGALLPALGLYTKEGRCWAQRAQYLACLATLTPPRNVASQPPLCLWAGC